MPKNACILSIDTLLLISQYFDYKKLILLLASLILFKGMTTLPAFSDFNINWSALHAVIQDITLIWFFMKHPWVTVRTLRTNDTLIL